MPTEDLKGAFLIIYDGSLESASSICQRANALDALDEDPTASYLTNETVVGAIDLKVWIDGEPVVLGVGDVVARDAKGELFIQRAKTRFNPEGKLGDTHGRVDSLDG